MGESTLRFRLMQQILNNPKNKEDMQKFTKDYEALNFGWRHDIEVPEGLMLLALRFGIVTKVTKVK
jgi:hypothetical protein